MGVPDWGLTSFAVLQGSRIPHNPAHSFAVFSICAQRGLLVGWIVAVLTQKAYRPS